MPVKVNLRITVTCFWYANYANYRFINQFIVEPDPMRCSQISNRLSGLSVWLSHDQDIVASFNIDIPPFAFDDFCLRKHSTGLFDALYVEFDAFSISLRVRRGFEGGPIMVTMNQNLASPLVFNEKSALLRSPSKFWRPMIDLLFKT